MILNLTAENSDVFKITKFPDGQQDITLVPSAFASAKAVEIASRMTSFKDVELIIAATAALRRIGIKSISLYIPYLLGARSDRQFVKGGTSYLVDVIAPVINAQNYEYVKVLDAHSDVAAACIKNLEVVHQSDLLSFVLNDFDVNDVVLVSPDGGALKKVYDCASVFGIKDIAIGSKHRDVTTGQITETTVTIPEGSKDKSFIVLDDLCDGGRTFIELSKALRDANVKWDKIFLVVSHGVFSKGVGALAPYFHGIYTTNSYPSEVSDTGHGSFLKVKKVI